MKSKYYGCGTALVTPFKEDKSIDYPALKRLVENQIEAGIDYLVVMGTTAENPTLSRSERQAILSYVVECNDNRLPVVFGIGGNNTAAIIEEMRIFDLSGVDAILSVTPYYNKPNQEALYRHYEAISEGAPLPIIAYNVPSRTGVNMSADTTIRIANNLKNVIAIKEASGDIEQIAYILKDIPDRFILISGDDNLALPVIALGGVGVISVSSNAIPKEVATYIHAAMKGDFAAARKILNKIMEFQDFIFEEGNPVGIKCAMNIKGMIENHFRLPLIPASEAYREKMNSMLRNAKI